MNILVLGLAKTGTTAVSEAIAKTVGATRYVSEPRSFEALDTAALARVEGGVVVKLIFEHWREQPNLRRGFVRNETPLAFQKRVFLLRDPRDELVSRMHFMIKPLLDQGKLAEAAVEEWIEVFRRKEADPKGVSVRRMVADLERLAGTERIDDITRNKPWYQFVAREPAEGHLLLRYEDFVADHDEALAGYLGVPRIVRENASRSEHRRRTGGSGDWRRLFTSEDVEHYRRKMGPMLAEIGYTDWALDPAGAPDPETGSRYVARLVERAGDSRGRSWPRRLFASRNRP
jgi:hypothetical protein